MVSLPVGMQPQMIVFRVSKSFTAAANLSPFPNSSEDIFRASKASSGTCKTISLMCSNVMLIVMYIFASSVSRERLYQDLIS